MRLKKAVSLTLIILLLSCGLVSAQYEYVELNLHLGLRKKKYSSVVLNMHYRDSTYLIEVVTWDGTGGVPDSAKVAIDKAKFNEITQLALSLSSADIIKGMNISNPSIWNDPLCAALSIRVFHEKIEYQVMAPAYKTKERQLTGYLQVCKQMLSVAGLRVKKIL